MSAFAKTRVSLTFADAVNAAAFFRTNSCTLSGACPVSVRTSSDIRSYAQEYSNALGRTVTYQDIPVEPWRDELLRRGLPVHLVNHLATMADLHRAGR